MSWNLLSEEPKPASTHTGSDEAQVDFHCTQHMWRPVALPQIKKIKLLGERVFYFLIRTITSTVSVEERGDGGAAGATGEP